MYGKIFARTFEHSMMGKGAHVFAVLSYVIAKTVDSHITLKPDYLAFVIGESEERIRQAIEFLASPDPESTGKEHDGRRIVPLEDVPHEYFVPRHEHYRAMRTSQDIRDATRERVRKFRAKKDQKTPAVNGEHDITRDDAITLLELMNELSGAKLRTVESNISPIVVRLNEDGVDLDGCAKMLRRQWELWKDAHTTDGKAMREFFKPSTIFKTGKFDNYYSARDLPITKSSPIKNLPEQNQLQEHISVPSLMPDGTKIYS